MIWLGGKDISDLVKIPITLGSERLNLKPNADNELYKLNRNLVHYQLVPEHQSLSKYGLNIADSYARVGLNHHFYIDSKHKKRKLAFWSLEVWDKIEDEFKDVFVYHELVEMKYLSLYHNRKFAHKTAVKSTRDYIQNHLSKAEQETFKKYLER